MKQVSIEELAQWRAAGVPFVLIDVREEEEHEAFNIGGRLLPLGEVVRHWEALKAAERPLVFYCKKGIRSQIAIQRLSQKMDVSECYNLAGGIGNAP